MFVVLGGGLKLIVSHFIYFRFVHSKLVFIYKYCTNLSESIWKKMNWFLWWCHFTFRVCWWFRYFGCTCDNYSVIEIAHVALNRKILQKWFFSFPFFFSNWNFPSEIRSSLCMYANFSSVYFVQFQCDFGFFISHDTEFYLNFYNKFIFHRLRAFSLTEC